MSATLAPLEPARRRHRLRRALTETGSVLLAVVILIWSLAPVYNMFLIALDPEEGEIEFDGNLWPPEPSLEGFREVITQEARYLETFWHQFGNSFFIGLLTMVLTGAMTSRCQLIAHGSGRCAIIASYGEIIESGAHLRHFAVRPDWARRGIPRSKRRDEANQRTGEWRE